jgi:hypothetical protein
MIVGSGSGVTGAETSGVKRRVRKLQVIAPASSETTTGSIRIALRPGRIERQNNLVPFSAKPFH